MSLALKLAQRENEIQKLDIRYMTKSGKEYTFSIVVTTKTSKFPEFDYLCPNQTLFGIFENLKGKKW